MQNKIDESDTAVVEEDLEEQEEVLAAELRQLKLLGLPTSFVRTTKKHKRDSKRSAAWDINHFFSDEDEAEEEVESDEDTNVQMANSTDALSKHEEKQIRELHSNEDDALHNLNQNSIVTKKSKKKNRKLKNIPEFLRTEKGLIKYWRKRFSLFSLFDEGIRLDRESWFSVTPEKVATHLAQRLACDVLVDAFCGCGGNTIQFAKTCRKVIAIDIDPEKVAMAKHNARIYGVESKIEFIVGDFLQLSSNAILRSDVVFLSPPWGGPKYKQKQDYNIERNLLPVSATKLMEHARLLSNNVAMFLPRNSNMQQIIKLAGIGNRCEVEHNYLDSRLIAITALYGESILSKQN